MDESLIVESGWIDEVGLINDRWDERDGWMIMCKGWMDEHPALMEPDALCPGRELELALASVQLHDRCLSLLFCPLAFCCTFGKLFSLFSHILYLHQLHLQRRPSGAK